MASESKTGDVDMVGGGSGAAAVGTVDTAATAAAVDRVKLKKWSAVALWSFDVGEWVVFAVSPQPHHVGEMAVVRAAQPPHPRTPGGCKKIEYFRLVRTMQPHGAPPAAVVVVAGEVAAWGFSRHPPSLSDFESTALPHTARQPRPAPLFLRRLLVLSR